MKRILIIEDDKSISELQKDYLEMSGMRLYVLLMVIPALNILKMKVLI